MKKKEKIEAVIAWTLAIIISHIAGYCYNYLGLDELIPCVIGYVSIAAILIVSFSDDVEPQIIEEPESEPAKVLICNNCKRFYMAPTDFCVACGSITLTETHPSNIQFITTKSNQNEK